MKRVLAVLSLLFLLNQADSQVSQEWAARYNGPPGNGHDYGYSSAVDGSGNVYTTGYSVGIGTGSFDYATAKYNSSGVQLWATRYNGPGNGTDYSYSIAVDGSGNSYVTGGSIGAGTDYDYCTIKYDASGVQQWVARYNGSANSQDFGRSVKTDGSGNVYVTGGSLASGAGAEYVTIKYNTSGVQLWLSKYNGQALSNYDEGYALELDGSGNVYVTGESFGDSTGIDYATIKYNNSGIQQWVMRFNGTGNLSDNANSIAVDPLGYVSVTGRSEGIGNNSDYLTIQYSPTGVQQWVQRYNGASNGYDYAYSIASDDSGNVFVTGQSKGATNFSEYATIKYNSAGVLKWASRYNGQGSGSDIARSLALDNSGNVYVTGNSSGTIGADDYLTIKYNPAGDSQWVARYDGPGHNTEECRSIAVDGSGNVYVTGFSYGGSSTNYDYATVKYSQSVGIHQISSEIPEHFILKQNYPNPFNPNTVINYELRVTNYISLKVYNPLGNEVAVLVNEKQNAGSYAVDFNGSNFTSGVYFYRLVTDEFTETKKMILTK